MRKTSRFLTLLTALLISVTAFASFPTGSVGNVTPIYAFTAFNAGSTSNTDGANPIGALVQDAQGNLYGTTQTGGSNGNGTIFEISSAGSFTVLHNFGPTTGNTDGAQPYAGLTIDANGTLYGVAATGGANGNGVVFKLVISGGTPQYSVLHTFAALTSSNPNINPDGAIPQGALLIGLDGSLYGTTTTGGSGGAGTVFSITTAGSNFTTLHHFGRYTAATVGSSLTVYENSDGAAPVGALVQDAGGTLWGTTQAGGTNGTGTVFAITTAGALTTIHTFGAYTVTSSGADVNSDGAGPTAALLIGSDNAIYGTTYAGGTAGYGAIFRISAGTGALTTLWSFTGNVDGGLPTAGLVQGSDSNLYGTTGIGGANTNGTVYSLPLGGGSVTTQYAFEGGFDGANPASNLLIAQGVAFGTFYGVAYHAGANGNGTVFKLQLGAAPPPTVSVASGSYPAAQTVTITDTAPGVTIYYTTNGAVPTTSSAVYTAPISVANSLSLQIIASGGGYATSPVTTATYTITATTGSSSGGGAFDLLGLAGLGSLALLRLFRKKA
jgi:uncharacterized repeat protein (TIGR03803 family)